MTNEILINLDNGEKTITQKLEYVFEHIVI